MAPSDPIELLASALWDFLSFRTFLSPTLLLVFYYLGALGAPLLFWVLTSRFKKQIDRIPLHDVDPATKAAITRWIPSRRRLYLYMALGFLVMEVFWRVMFEFLLAYFQMRDYLATMQAG